MKRLRLLFLFFSLSAAACAGGSSRYGCPAEPGYSCKSVSEVYAEATSGGKSSVEPLRKSPASEKRIHVAGSLGKKLAKGRKFRSGRDTRSRTGSEKTQATHSEDKKTMPVYLPPPVIRLWIAPWQDSRGVFHSEKYVYAIVGKGRWMIGERSVPLGAPGEERPGSIRLRAAGRTP